MNDFVITLQNKVLQVLSELGAAHGEQEDDLQRFLSALVEFAPKSANSVNLHPELIASLFTSGLSKRRRRKSYVSILSAWRERIDDAELSLRRFHRSELIRIAIRDLCGIAGIQVITNELALLADVVVSDVYDRLWNEHVLKHGEPIGESSGESSRMCVIGMGKQGGYELNFSSDIDVMFAYEEDGETAGGPQGKLENRIFFTNFAQEFCDILTRPTPDGFLYRIDTRLRPEGGSGMLATPLMAVEIYYHTYGQNWERQALIKARPIAGDDEVGRRFMSLITPFTYRRLVDDIEIADVLRDVDRLRIRSMQEIGEEKQRVNFKNGYGGIRDVEFFVQAVQMLYGRQYPEVKLAGTLVSLQRMFESHLLHSSDYETLTSAYQFLRRIEHRMQMVNEQQVYELPADEEERARLARSMDYENYAALEADYQKITANVRKIYEGVFQRTEWEDPSSLIIEAERVTPEIEALLGEYDFENPRQAFSFLKALQKASEPHLQPKTTRLFKAILPRLLHILKESPDSDMALSNFEKLISNFRARTALYEEMNNQRSVFNLLVSIISCSHFLTRLILRDPSLMETLGSEELLETPIVEETLQRHLTLIQSAHQSETLRDHLLRVQNAAMFRSGVRFILGITGVEQTGRDLAQIADFVLNHSFQPVTEQLTERFPTFTRNCSDNVAVIGYGKLGGRDFNIASDCDIVFVYEEGNCDGEVGAGEFFHRWAGKYVNYLESKSALGFLYKPDARLRPHGHNSPMACNWESFTDYYENHAQLWEKMALSRARWIGGADSLRAKLSDFQQKLLFQRALRRDEFEAILDMRRKIEQEKQSEVLKAGPGGLVDVEFIAQTLLLHYGCTHPAIRSTATIEVIRLAAKEGLLDEQAASPLIESYLFLREIENRLRIVNNVSMDGIPKQQDELEELTRRYALRLDTEKPTPEIFLQWIAEHTHQVRKIFNQFFNEQMNQA
ncbi:MAG: bifunctional [glutamate--ammonia ligase]-adenylyl-L-tyrosine phosphorylase/[glutamate--ammonia-ligase] adenylyltransferase [Candidatus Hinthialibacter antarcticus]|nr:bifunctional [glutamate--ammonia ligase]-adenylyl-L-tyrosine phosphorylase/[glutamate--ammonia-ligase] adenylyltransferase [Candidatus Hinthialibacter antarcticus]